MKNKIETKIECPKCGTIIDVKEIKQAIKNRLDMELDHILDEL